MSYANDPMDQVREGMAVHGADGQRIGVAGEVSVGLFTATVDDQTVMEERAYFRLRRDYGPDLYLPGTAIADIGTEGVTLAADGDSEELERYGTHPTAAGQGGDDDKPGLPTSLP